MALKNITTYSFIILIALILPKISFAQPIWYGNIIKLTGDTAYLQIGSLEDKHYFSCSIQTQQCQEIPENIATTKESTLKTKNLSIRFPSNSTHRNISPNNEFGVYMTLNNSSGARTFGLIDKKNGKNYKITDQIHFWNLLDQQPRVSSFAPDESSLAYVSDRSGFASIYIVPLTKLSNTKLKGTAITSGVTVGDFTYIDNRNILFIANTKNDPYNWVLYSYDIQTKTKKVLAENLVYDTTLKKSGNAILFTQLTPLGTMPVVLTDPLNGEIKPFMTSLSTPASDEKIKYNYQKLGNIDTVSMKRINDSELNSHPLIVWLHGGPYRQASFQRHSYLSYGVYDWILEEAVNQGAYVLKIDYAGSYGSGKTHTESIKNSVGKKDVDDVIKTINLFTKNNNISDVYVVGNSYGGYLALRAMTAYPKSLGGALSINGVTDWTTLLDFYKNSIFNTLFNGKPSKKNLNLYKQASILSRLKQIKNPIYIVQAEKDTTIPEEQAIILKRTLDKINKTSTLTLIPDEDHIFKKNSSINIICKTLFEMVKLDASNSCNLQN